MNHVNCCVLCLHLYWLSYGNFRFHTCKLKQVVSERGAEEDTDWKKPLIGIGRVEITVEIHFLGIIAWISLRGGTDAGDQVYGHTLKWNLWLFEREHWEGASAHPNGQRERQPSSRITRNSSFCFSASLISPKEHWKIHMRFVFFQNLNLFFGKH